MKTPNSIRCIANQNSNNTKFLNSNAATLEFGAWSLELSAPERSW